MAALTDQVTGVYRDGACDRTVLYALKGCTAGDTVDVFPDFRVVKRAGIVSVTGTTIAVAAVSGGTILTLPAGPNADAVWLLVVGVAS